MPRDYKHRVSRKRKRPPVSPWVGVMAGLLIGLFVAFLVYIRMQAAPDQPPVIPEIGQDALDRGTEPSLAEQVDDTNPARPAPPKPRFDFYTLLPEMEVVIPEEEVNAKVEAHARAKQAARSAAPAVKTPDIQPVESPDTYFLQVGSFRNGEQAERFKAELALLGLETNIQKVTINNRDTWHRVRVGPFNSLGALDRARKLLGRQGIESTTIKIKG
ncbi:MAG: SPOR domain-containing protein [Gammaproteobacteria bacterium]|jgi:cell division protein FtsN